MSAEAEHKAAAPEGIVGRGSVCKAMKALGLHGVRREAFGT